MKTTMDDAGRVTIPEELRSKFGLKSGESIEIESDGSRILLKPESHLDQNKPDLSEEDCLEWEGNVLVYTGKIPKELYDVSKFIEELDAERDCKIWNPEG